MNSKLNTGDRGNGTAAPEWLADLMLRRDSKLLSRFVFYYRELQRRPRRWRRLLRRKLALTVTGAALLLALAGGPIATSAFAEPIDTNATIAVVNGEVAINDNNKCSLMEAIINARATKARQLYNDCRSGNLNGRDTVSLPAGGEFVLTAPHNSQFGPTGLPVITSAVAIDGNGATIRRSTVTGTPEFRILAVDPAGDLRLRDTTISNGYIHEEYGGGIFSDGVLTVEGSTITNNHAREGGGVFAAQATVTGSVISNNESEGGYYGAGGGIRAETLVVENSTISGNDGGDGGGIRAVTATISGSRIVDNVASEPYGAEGGGIQVKYLTLTDSVVAGNTAFGGEDYGGFGGGIDIYSGTISGSTISSNRAIVGLGGYNYDYPEPAKGGGIMASGLVTIVNSTISDNEANEGGGLYAPGAVTLTHSTLSGNNARTDTNGSYGYYGTVGGYGGGILVANPYACSALTVVGNLISGNTAAVQGSEVLAEQSGQCAATVIADAFNVFGSNGDSGAVGFTPGATDVIPTVGLSAILSPPADNGGPTQTHALPTGSPALDIAPNDSCAAAPVNGVDQRGEPRNANGAGDPTANECDAGSFELQSSGGSGMAFLVSPTRSGAVGGVDFSPSDILKYDPATGWSMYFDGSDAGITRNLSDFAVLGNGDILMSFSARQVIPDVGPGMAGTFMPQDIARFVPTALGDSTSGSFQWALDGSDNFLTAGSERIDALADIGDGRTALSTTGTATVNLPGGARMRAQDEDALAIDLAGGDWSAWFDGTAIPGLGREDVNAMWIDPATGDIYITIVGSFSLGGLRGNSRDIVKLTVDSGAPGGYVPSLWWDGSAAGFPTNLDGLEILP